MCLYVSVCARVCECVSVWVCVAKCVCLLVCEWLSVFVCEGVCMCVSVCVCVSVWSENWNYVAFFPESFPKKKYESTQKGLLFPSWNGKKNSKNYFFFIEKGKTEMRFLSHLIRDLLFSHTSYPPPVYFFVAFEICTSQIKGSYVFFQVVCDLKINDKCKEMTLFQLLIFSPKFKFLSWLFWQM